MQFLEVLKRLPCVHQPLQSLQVRRVQIRCRFLNAAGLHPYQSLPDRLLFFRLRIQSADTVLKREAASRCSSSSVK